MMTLSPSTQTLLNPIWHALNTEHAHFAIGDKLARRYPSEVSPLAGIESQSDAAYAALREIVEVGNSVFVFLTEPPIPTKDWQVKVTIPLLQMVCESFQEPSKSDTLITALSDEHIPEMLELTKLTEPGPFEAKTSQMGNYLGIWQDGRLAAMSGERLHLNGFTEVSAVCTHPDFRGKGYAKELVAAVCKGIIERNEIPFLHSKHDNEGAIRVYESLGFRKVEPLLHFAILARIS